MASVWLRAKLFSKNGLVRGPPGKGEDTARGKADDAPFPVENLLVGDVAELRLEAACWYSFLF